MASDSSGCGVSAELEEGDTRDLSEEERREKDIQALREKVLSNEALSCRTDTKFLLMFLRACHFNLEESYKVILDYFTMRAERKEHFHDLTPTSVSQVWERGVTQVLPKPDKLGRSILYICPGKWEPTEFPMMEIFKANVINMESCVQEEEAQKNGLVIINNAEGFGWKHFRHIQRSFFKLSSDFMQDAIPARMEAFHIVNQPRMFQYVFRIIRPFLKSELVSKMQFHGHDLSSLTRDTGLSADVLPAELGGTLPAGDLLAEQYKEKVLCHEQYFADQLKYHIKQPT